MKHGADIGQHNHFKIRRDSETSTRCLWRCTPAQVSAEGSLNSGSLTTMRTDFIPGQGWSLHPSSADVDRRFGVSGLSPPSLRPLGHHVSSN